MGKKAGLTLEDVVDAAATIADRDGLEAASLRAVADQLGIKTPSLYNHVPGLSGLRRELALHAAKQLTAAFEQEAASAPDTVSLIRMVFGRYRAFSKEHPGLYRSMSPAPKPGEDDELYEALAAPVVILADSLASVGIKNHQAIHLIRALRSMVHGFVDLEMNGGFGMPVDIDDSFDRAIDTVLDGITDSMK